MNYREKFFNLFTMCAKSGSLAKGFDVSKESVTGGKAACVMVTSDVSPKTLKETAFMCKSHGEVPLVELPFTMEDIGNSIGRKAGVMAVCDAGFARKLREYAEQAREENNV
ncbi:MAG: ribosomal L7Ae/L30e/S12e/Gadd45 family protein [Oscillospiraceae bacterium]|jgi:ribosomal protein L7Ae-like RNA K-turn-binding protein|nr:ribosomal L7Ae/L30e/S12e/Gadd45 family protein [Oscillospiraceae bacterium]MBP1567401.1 ribosomal L7Ae/L30e/S12e/Gadd45 family protein [Oscillospiraceae bacterium]MBP1592447.1 ribosomal L7Ae/L30e/S12e/Gadd45 family protein [Oscillospiraceae bacterium]